MKIAICEDDRPQAKIVSHYLKEMASEYDIHKVAYYPNGEDLFTQIDAGVQYDVFLLDIELPGISGIELGSLIQNKDKHAIIIYISGYTQYITAAFHQRNVQYLLKPIKSSDLRRIFHILMQELRDDLFCGKLNQNKPFCVPFSEIVYVEFYHNETILHMTQKEQTVTGEFRLQKKLLLEKGFIQTHQGYYVNPQFISHIRDSSVFCTNHVAVPISARQKKQVREQFWAYLQRKHLTQNTPT